jgi:tetratricopeptide (TPR) repeat protein
MPRAATLCLAATVLLAAAAPAWADRIVTLAGATLVGRILEEDAQKVVIRTDGGTVTVPRETIRTLEKDLAPPAGKGPEAGTSEGGRPAAPPPEVKPVEVAPADAPKAFDTAKAAVAAGEWRKAAGFLEGLLQLDQAAFPPEKRLGALGALVTCYLQIKDARGAARAYTRRAALVTDADEKRRMLVAAEALRETGSVTLAGKSLGRYEEAIEAAMAWKAARLLDLAKQSAVKATGLDDPARLEKAALAAQDKLKEADAYAPGSSDAHREEVLGVFVTTITDAAREVVAFCTEERKELTRTRLASVASKPLALEWNARGGPYLAKRQAAENAVKNLRPFTRKFEVPSLYDAALCRALLADLDDLQYYPPDVRTSGGGRMKIALRRF